MRLRASLQLCLSLIFFGSTLAFGGETPPSEYAVKSAFLLNFLKFVEWPSDALPGSTAPITIGLYGGKAMRKDLDDVVQNRKIAEHPIQIKELQNPADAVGCQMVFFVGTPTSETREWLDKLKGKSILTVGETEGFLEAGGMINFVRAGTKIRFQISKEPVAAAGLQMSAKLLMLAIPFNRQ